MPKSVALMRRMENLRKTNEPGSKQKIQRTRRKRTTQHLENSDDQQADASEERNHADNVEGESSRVHTMEGTSTAGETLVSDASPMSEPTSTSSSDQTSDVNERNVQARYSRDSLNEASVTPVQQASTSSVADGNSGNSSKE